MDIKLIILGTPQNNLGTPLGVPTPNLGTPVLLHNVIHILPLACMAACCLPGSCAVEPPSPVKFWELTHGTNGYSEFISVQYGMLVS